MIAFLTDIKKRYEERVSSLTSTNIKRGGNEYSPYFANPCVLQFDLYPHNPVLYDEIALISEEYANNLNARDITKYQEQMPQYQLLFANKDILADSLKIIFCALIKVYVDPDKRKEISNTFKCFVENFLGLELNYDETFENDIITEEEVKIFLSDSFLSKRLENMEQPLDDLLEVIKRDDSKENDL